MLGRDEPTRGGGGIVVERLYAARPVHGATMEVATVHPGREHLVGLTREFAVIGGGDVWCFTVEVVR